MTRTRYNLFVMDTPYAEWINIQLDQVGERVKSIEPVHSGQDNVVFIVLTDESRYYLKICDAPNTHEPPLMTALDSWLPGYVPHVLAYDAVHNWLLMADAGQTLRASIRSTGKKTLSDKMLRMFADLQQQMIPHREELLDLGVPDRRLTQLPGLYDSLIADTSALLVGQENGISEKDLNRLRKYAQTIRELCTQLSDYSIPETIQHDDFHTGNVGENFQIFDWGESSIAHPFYSILIALRDAKFTLKYGPRVLDRLRDVYLETWTDYAPLTRLYEVLKITHQLAALGRALSWWQVIQYTSENHRSDYTDAVPYWLLAFLNNTPLA